MTFNVVRRSIAGLVLMFLLSVVSAPTQIFAQSAGDTAVTAQRSGQVIPSDDEEDGMDLGWLGLLGLVGLLGLRRRNEVHRVDTTTRTTRP